MLSRVAHSLYWMARYIERAENIARIVDVNLQLLLDLRDLDEQKLAEYWLPIVQSHRRRGGVLQAAPETPPRQAVTEFLVFQTGEPEFHRAIASARRAKTPAWCATSSRSSSGRN